MKQELIVDPEVQFERIERFDGPVLGQWYWVRESEKRYIEQDNPGYWLGVDPKREAQQQGTGEWIGCAMKVGSNYVQLESPSGWSTRLHLDQFWTSARHEPNAQECIRSRIAGYQNESLRLLGEVQALAARLGMANVGQLAGPASNALVVLNQEPDIKKYEKALILAKTKQLPELFKAIKLANENLATWMKGPAMALKATVGDMESAVAEIDDRIFSISLYAGLAEEAIPVAKGKPADLNAKLHVMQRMLFMDEESLLDYQHGGMDFNKIGDFDRFLAKPHNRDRILPFPRTLVAMRVRRNPKAREAWSLSQAYVNIQMEQADKYTYLYIRNGEQVWCLACEMDFGELIFPDRAMLNPDEPKMFKMWGGGDRVEEFISTAGYEQLVEAEKAWVKASKERAKKLKAWRVANPGASWIDEPYELRADWGHRSDVKDWHPLNTSSVYYDDAMAELDKKIKEYNRVALIIQGLFDRSQVLHPHLPVQSWTAEGFDRAITLMNDGSGAITYGEPPDFEAYRKRCNATIGVGSITIGQQDYWQKKEAEKECKRRDADYRDKGSYRPTRYSPYGNPGPAEPGPVDYFNPKQGAVFRWQRERRGRGNKGYYSDLSSVIKCSVQVPTDELFNVDGYKLGDFKQFFQDPRTRQQYLQWAPILLEAEEYVAKRDGLPTGRGRKKK